LSERITPYRLTAAVARKRIHAIAVDTGKIKWSFHALGRMEERGIFDVDVLAVLRTGTVAGSPELTPLGEWRCKMVRQIRGSREAGVITLILKSGCLFIKTVEWEDL
jgi:hypothetical protein